MCTTASYSSINTCRVAGFRYFLLHFGLGHKDPADLILCLPWPLMVLGTTV